MGCCDHHVFGTHYDKRHTKYIDGMTVFTGIIPDDIANAVFRHLFGQSIPGT